jgi:hypothetical protein
MFDPFTVSLSNHQSPRCNMRIRKAQGAKQNAWRHALATVPRLWEILEQSSSTVFQQYVRCVA